jgi:hypothetical protein
MPPAGRGCPREERGAFPDNRLVGHQILFPTKKEKEMNTNRQITVIQEHNTERTRRPTAVKLIRWAGVSAMVAGICYVVVGLFHPPNVLASVTTSQWAIVHILASVMCFFGILGMAGLYARQAETSGWLGLAGFVLLSLWFAVILGFSFVETVILPPLATEAPTFVDGFLAVVTGTTSEMNLGALPTVWMLTAPLYILGGLLFGIATFRARILPRWAGVLLAVGTALAPVAGLLPLEQQPKIAVPVGVALSWLGYALWSERREHASDPVPGSAIPQVLPTAVK